MWTIVLICDECAGADTTFPEVRANDVDEAGDLTRHEAQIRGWLCMTGAMINHLHGEFPISLDLCPACAPPFREMQEKAGIDL